MIKRVPLLNPTDGQQYLLSGETTDIVPNERTVYIDREGNTFDPAQRKVSFDELPQDGVIELPRTTWWIDEETFEILPDGIIVPLGMQPLRKTPIALVDLNPITTWCFLDATAGVACDDEEGRP